MDASLEARPLETLSLCMAALPGQIMHLEDSDSVGGEVSVRPRAAS